MGKRGTKKVGVEERKRETDREAERILYRFIRKFCKDTSETRN